MGSIHTIDIDLDKKCKECGKGGATPSGFCLGCVNKAIGGKTMKTVEGRAFAKRVQDDLKRHAKDLKKRLKARPQPATPSLFKES